MKSVTRDTQRSDWFTPTARASREEIDSTRKKILFQALLPGIIEAIPDYVLVLNRERQILAVNSRLTNAFGIDAGEELIGKRPGEALGCLFAHENPGGCGATRHCTTCGAIRSIMESQENNAQTTSECRVILHRGREIALDLEVISTPTTVDDIPLTLCVMKDISAEKRRAVLEQVFLHDILNTVGGIQGLASALADRSHLEQTQETEYTHWIVDLSKKLVEEIIYQRKLIAAERGEFKPELGLVSLPALLHDVHALFATHDIATNRQLLLGNISDSHIISDPFILRRILGNMVKNALEATPAGAAVTLAAEEAEHDVTFSVNNPGVMPEEVQLQIFQRSFSTKGETGRGIGTYSIKLFGERYLNGKVSFTSRDFDGTTFTLTLTKTQPE